MTVKRDNLDDSVENLTDPKLAVHRMRFRRQRRLADEESPAALAIFLEPEDQR